MLVRKNPGIGFISLGVLEVLVGYHVVLDRSSFGFDCSGLPSHHFGANDININRNQEPSNIGWRGLPDFLDFLQMTHCTKQFVRILHPSWLLEHCILADWLCWWEVRFGLQGPTCKLVEMFTVLGCVVHALVDVVGTWEGVESCSGSFCGWSWSLGLRWIIFDDKNLLLGLWNCGSSLIWSCRAFLNGLKCRSCCIMTVICFMKTVRVTWALAGWEPSPPPIAVAEGGEFFCDLPWSASISACFQLSSAFCFHYFCRWVWQLGQKSWILH